MSDENMVDRWFMNPMNPEEIMTNVPKRMTIRLVHACFRLNKLERELEESRALLLRERKAATTKLEGNDFYWRSEMAPLKKELERYKVNYEAAKESFEKLSFAASRVKDERDVLKKRVEALEKELNQSAICDKCSELVVSCVCKSGILGRG